MKKLRFRIAHRKGPKAAEGYALPVGGLRLVVHKEDNWEISDFRSGIRLAGREAFSTRASAIAHAKENANAYVDILRLADMVEPELNPAEGWPL